MDYQFPGTLQWRYAKRVISWQFVIVLKKSGSGYLPSPQIADLTNLKSTLGLIGAILMTGKLATTTKIFIIGTVLELIGSLSHLTNFLASFTTFSPFYNNSNSIVMY